MGYFGNFLRHLILPYSSLTQAEIRASGLEVGIPSNLAVSWVDLFGDPYYKAYAAGSENTAESGWVDLAGNAKVKLQCRVTGESGASGNVVFKFLVGPSAVNTDFDDVDATLNVTVAASGTNTVVEDSVIDVKWRYLRLYSVTNGSGKTCNCEVRVFGAVAPVFITKL
jgi:hypothetical protein